jgi:hypothetical protein
MLPVLLFFLFTGALAILAFLLTGRLRDLRLRSDRQERVIASLTERVWRLENEVPVRPEPQPEPEPIEVAPPPPPAKPVKAAEDWETLVGANWLNRLGALILVIGIALFLGYSLTQLGPAGKIGIGIAAGAALLIGGIALERQPQYRTFSFSLMGAGWAILYFAAYAAHGVPAARIIDSPAIAVLLLMAVSAAMIVHALRYRSETATSLAYLLGFVGLNVSPLTSFSVVASLILSLSLIAIAYRFDWFRLPLLGITLTYTTFVLRYDPAIYSQPGVLNAQATLWIYWLTFEIYDLLDVRRRGRGRGIERTLFLLNASGFVGASLLHEWNMTSRDWSVYFALASCAYLVSTLLRSRWAEDPADRPRVFEGGYEAAASLSALLMAGALIERFSGTRITLALLLESELVFLAGAALRSSWLRNFGAAMLLLPFIRLTVVDATSAGKTTLLGLQLEHWTPTALLLGAVLALNRRLADRSWYFSAGAAFTFGLVLAVELPRLWVAPVLALGGLLLTLIPLRDLVLVGSAAVFAAFLRATAVNVTDSAALTGGIAVAAIYTAQLLWKQPPLRIRPALSIMGTLLLTVLIYQEAPGRLFTVLCGIEGAVLLAAGFILTERVFRLSGLALFLLCLARLFFYDLRRLDTGSRILSFIVLGVVLLIASWVYTRFREKLKNLL